MPIVVQYTRQENCNEAERTFTMVRKQFLIGLFAVAFAVGVCGCAGMQKGPSDEELIQQTLMKWKSGVESQDLDTMMAAVSEDFVSDEGGSKADFREYLAGVIDEGYLTGAEMDIESATVVIEDQMATAENLGLSGDRGSVILDMDLKKEEDGVWRIVGLQAY